MSVNMMAASLRVSAGVGSGGSLLMGAIMRHALPGCQMAHERCGAQKGSPVEFLPPVRGKVRIGDCHASALPCAPSPWPSPTRGEGTHIRGASEIKQTRVAELLQRHSAHGEAIFLFRGHLSKRLVTAQGLKDRIPAKAVGAARYLWDNTLNCSREDASICAVGVAKERSRCSRPVGFSAQQFADPFCPEARQEPFDQRSRQPVPGSKG